MYTLQLQKSFKKSYKKVSSHKNFKEEVFNFIIEELRCGRKLDAKFRDHELTGNYKGYRDCHVQNDIVLIYKYEHDILWLVLNEIGSHSELFK
jgi:mRNA interferase YafQ